MSVSENTAIHVQGVSKSFGDAEVLHEVSRDFEEGKIHGIVGNNGSGKTVLMKCICGFLRPDKGSILVRGKQVGRDMDFPDDMGIIIETPGFLPKMSGSKNLALLASLRRRIDREAIRRSIERVGLDPDSKKPVGKYSLGMRQRLGLAAAFLGDESAAPEVLRDAAPVSTLASFPHEYKLVQTEEEANAYAGIVPETKPEKTDAPETTAPDTQVSDGTTEQTTEPTAQGGCASVVGFGVASVLIAAAAFVARKKD